MTDTIRYIIAGALILLIIVLQPVYMKWLGYDTSQPDLEQTSQAQTINPAIEKPKKYFSNLAITGLYFAKIAGLSALRSGFNQLVKNEMPIYEIISGAALAFAALLLIIPGFLTDLFGFLLILPITRKFFISFLL